MKFDNCETLYFTNKENDQDFLLEAARHPGVRDKSPKVKKSKRKEWQAHNKVNTALSWADFFQCIQAIRPS